MSARPRVALLSREYPPEVYGGAGVHVEHLARSLAAYADVAVHCFGKPRQDPLVAATYEPWESLAGEAPELAALRTFSVDLAMAAGVGDVDLVHSHTWYANLAGHLWKLTNGRPHVMTAHSLEPLRPWKREQLGGGYELSRFAERTAIEAADAVIAVSGGMRDDIMRCYPAVDPDRVHVVHNGIDPDVYRPVEGSDVLAAHGLDPDRPVVLFVGRITRQKGLPHLLDAALELEPEAQLVLCAGEPDTVELGREVRAHVEALTGQRDGVVWIEDMLPRDDLVQLLSHATVLVCPSVYEPFGLVNVEAMACGTAVVASAVGGIPEIVVEGETGCLVPFATGEDGSSPADPEAFAHGLAERVNELVRDQDRAARFGEAGRARVLERFTWRAIAERSTEIYRRLL
ncbi:MAG: glycogen synthase [Nitriliruptorales bacterium]